MVTLEQVLQGDEWFAASVSARLRREIDRLGEAISAVSGGAGAGCRLVGQSLAAHFV